MEIIIPVIVLGVMGLVFGALLGIAAKAFRVEKDERIEQVQELLAGANCGGCGYAGCSAFAEAVVAGKANPSACPSTKKENIHQIAEIMGVSVEDGEKMVAKVLCSGTCDKTSVKYQYDGITDCVAVYRFGGGEKTCLYGCTGYGSCVRACLFDAIHVIDGVAHVDRDKCTGCGACVSTCPKRIIELVPAKQRTFVVCRSKEKGVVIKDICQAGCIGCKICEKNCPKDAVHVVDNIAKIDYDKCVNCGICASKCPRHVIEFKKRGEE